jgi:hypothetical protein
MGNAQIPVSKKQKSSKKIDPLSQKTREELATKHGKGTLEYQAAVKAARSAALGSGAAESSTMSD